MKQVETVCGLDGLKSQGATPVEVGKYKTIIFLDIVNVTQPPKQRPQTLSNCNKHA